MSEATPLKQIFDAHDGRLIHKWNHYFDIYERHLARFRGTAATVVEIGVSHGGSLQMWRKYFGPQARIIGVDIDPRAEQFAEDGIEILIGDQGDREFLGRLAEQAGAIDVLIDDGGHKMQQQIATLVELFNAVKEEGVILTEDTHTSYWRSHGGGFRHSGTFLEFCKGKVDDLHAWHSRDADSFSPGRFTRKVRSVHFYDSIVVFEKGPNPRPKTVTAGTPVFELPEGWEKFGQ